MLLELSHSVAELDERATFLRGQLSLQDAWKKATNLHRPVRIVPKNLNTVRQQLDNIIKTTS